MSDQISEERSAAYYIGGIMMVVGVLSFFSVFITGAMHFGDFSNFEERGRSEMLRAFGGMGLIVLGGIIRGIGARGLAGSGVILDPKQAREDLEPYSRMAGGMLKDTLNEADIHLGSGNVPTEEKVVVKVRCSQCGHLNSETAKFCEECGAKQ
jgi:hypothetical protein